jgi:predicted permease
VLLVACANAAGLMLVRASEREGELAVRAALGAPPGRLVRLVVTEGLLLAALGGGAGWMAAAGVRSVLAAVLRDAIGEIPKGRLDTRVAVFVAVATLASGLAFALLPSVRAGRAPLEVALRAGGRGATRSRLRARRALAVAEIAAAVVLLAGTGLLVRTVRGLLSVSPGFDPAGALVVRVAPHQSRPAAGQTEEAFVRAYLVERDRIARFYDELLGRARAWPGVTAAGAINRLPLTGRWWTINVTADDRPVPARAERPTASGRVATPGYFEAMRIPLRAGRAFTAADGAAAPSVAIVSESLARRTWPGQDPIGRRLTVDEQPGLTVVGVAGDVRVEGLDTAAPPIVYVPFAQAQFGLFPDWGMDLVVRATGDPGPWAAALQSEVRRLDPALPVFAARTVDDVLGGWLARRRAALVLFGAFAAIAVTLAGVGLYGVVAQSARQRTREIGVRVAVGARPWDIARLVLGEGLALAACGAVLGMAAAAVGGRLLSSLLFGVSPADPWTLAATALALALVATAAALLPARRASGIDPVVALRQD